MSNNYTVDYFIKKFEGIPPKRWATGELQVAGTDCRCAAGHCGITSDNPNRSNPELEALAKWLRLAFSPRVLVECTSFGVVWRVNDGSGSVPKSFGKTPRTRILNVLKRAKKKKTA